jgi:hypothetical protein
VAVLRIDPKTGEPMYTNNYAPVLSPSHFVFVDG